MAKKKTKSTSAKDARLKKARLAALRRAHANPFDYPIDFGPLRGPVDTQALAEHLPLPPAHTHHDLSSGESRALHLSPARTWLDVAGTGVSEGARETIARWPFRIVKEKQKAPPEQGWTCLRLLALGTDQTVEDLSRSLAELEDAALQYWHSQTNVYILPADVPDTSQMSPQEALSAIDTFTEARASEPAVRRAARKWARVMATSAPVTEDEPAPQS